MTLFSDLQLAAPLLNALDQEGYTTPTPIQAQAIPAVMAGSDLLGIAQTGTGKTAAFALPILHRLAANRRHPQRKGCRALILSPTRELASQIADSFRTYGRHLNMKIAVVFGGVSFGPQARQLDRGVDILIATPGRLLDHMGQRTVAIEGTEVFVLDEADQMLDLGFLPPIRRIVERLSAKRQNLFFSATMPREIGKLAEELLRDPVKVSVTPAATTVERVAQRVILVEPQKKKSLLVELFGDEAVARALVFTRTKRGADKVAKHLEGAGIGVAAIHGNKSQRQREDALHAFRNSKIRVLVATDIAARGIDIDNVTHVVNFELPEVPESYVHRIGRTGRAGAAGTAISLCAGEERGLLRDIERTTRQIIPTEDRRGDTALAVEVKAAGATSHDRQGRDGRERQRGGDRGRNRNSDRSGYGRSAGSEGRRFGERRSDRGREQEESAGKSWSPVGETAHASVEALKTATREARKQHDDGARSDDFRTRDRKSRPRGNREHGVHERKHSDRRSHDQNSQDRTMADTRPQEASFRDRKAHSGERGDGKSKDRAHYHGRDNAVREDGHRHGGGRKFQDRRTEQSSDRSRRHGQPQAVASKEANGAASLANVAFLAPNGKGERTRHHAENGQHRRDGNKHGSNGSPNGRQHSGKPNGKPGGWSGLKRRLGNADGRKVS